MTTTKKMSSDNPDGPLLTEHYIHDRLVRGERMYDWHPLDGVPDDDRMRYPEAGKSDKKKAKKMSSDNPDGPLLTKHYIHDRLVRGDRMYDWHPLDGVPDDGMRYPESGKSDKNKAKK